MARRGDNVSMASRQKAVQTIVSELCERIRPIANDALARGFVFFDCRLDLGPDSVPIVLRFADGNGAYYQRSFGLRQFGIRSGFTLTRNHNRATGFDRYIVLKPNAGGLGRTGVQMQNRDGSGMGGACGPSAKDPR